MKFQQWDTKRDGPLSEKALRKKLAEVVGNELVVSFDAIRE